MCEYCQSMPHSHGCPFEDDPPFFAECDLCRCEIYVGEDYFEINGLQICEDCMAKQRRTADYKAEDCKAEDCSE